MKKSRFFQLLVGFIAIAVAAAAAYFSVFGLSKLFAGAMLAAIIMASALEAGKLILASYLYRFWEVISKSRRVYGVIAVAILMFITSVGIYGFLSNAYERTSIQLEQQDSKMEIVETRILAKEQEKTRFEQLINDKQQRITTLTDLRKQQEVRLDSLLSNEHWVNARRTTTSISNADIEIQKMYGEIDELNIRLDSANQQIVQLKTERLDYKVTDDVSAEVGPLKYISRLTGRSMDKVVNWVILLLILVFDPLAIYLILAYNHLVIQSRKEKKVGDVEKNSYIKSNDDISYEKPIINIETDPSGHRRRKDLFDKMFNKSDEVKRKIKTDRAAPKGDGRVTYYEE